MILDNTTILLLHELIIAFFSQFSSPPHIINGDVVSRVDSKQAAASYIIKKDITFSFSKSPFFVVLVYIVYEGL